MTISAEELRDINDIVKYVVRVLKCYLHAQLPMLCVHNTRTLANTHVYAFLYAHRFQLVGTALDKKDFFGKSGKKQSHIYTRKIDKANVSLRPLFDNISCTRRQVGGCP